MQTPSKVLFKHPKDNLNLLTDFRGCWISPTEWVTRVFMSLLWNKEDNNSVWEYSQSIWCMLLLRQALSSVLVAITQWTSEAKGFQPHPGSLSIKGSYCKVLPILLSPVPPPAKLSSIDPRTSCPANGNADFI